MQQVFESNSSVFKRILVSACCSKPISSEENHWAAQIVSRLITLGLWSSKRAAAFRQDSRIGVHWRFMTGRPPSASSLQTVAFPHFLGSKTFQISECLHRYSEETPPATAQLEGSVLSSALGGGKIRADATYAGLPRCEAAALGAGSF